MRKHKQFIGERVKELRPWLNKKDWVNVQVFDFKIGDSVRFNGVEYYCRVPTEKSPAEEPTHWETFWPVVLVTGSESARPHNASMRQNTILYRTQNNSTFVEHFKNGKWESMNVRTTVNDVAFSDGVMLPQELKRISGLSQTVQENLNKESASIRNMIGDLNDMSSVHANFRGNVRTSVNWTAGEVNRAHQTLDLHNGRIRTLEGRDFASQFLSLDGGNTMKGNLNLGNQTLRINANNSDRTIIQAVGSNRSIVEFGSSNVAQVSLIAANDNIRIGSQGHSIIHSGNIGSQSVHSASNVGGLTPGNIARRNEHNTFSTGQTINGDLTMGGSTSRVRSNSGNLVLGSGTSNTLTLSGNNATVAGTLTSNLLVGTQTRVNEVRNHSGGRVYMNTTNGSFANFPHSGGLAIQGRRLFIQPSRPSGGQRGDVWLESF